MSKSTVADEGEFTYNIGLMTCKISPGAQACEYTVRSSSRPFNVIDLLVWISVVFLIKSTEYRYALGLVAVWIFIKRKSVKKESILAIRDVGIQVQTVYWGGSTVSRFINRLKIEDVIINEGISFWQIKSYMAILVKDEDKMVVVFENLLPKLRPILLRVYRGTRAIIFSQQPADESDLYYTTK